MNEKFPPWLLALFEQRIRSMEAIERSPWDATQKRLLASEELSLLLHDLKHLVPPELSVHIQTCLEAHERIRAGQPI